MAGCAAQGRIGSTRPSGAFGELTSTVVVPPSVADLPGSSGRGGSGRCTPLVGGGPVVPVVLGRCAGDVDGTAAGLAEVLVGELDATGIVGVTGTMLGSASGVVLVDRSSRRATTSFAVIGAGRATLTSRATCPMAASTPRTTTAVATTHVPIERTNGPMSRVCDRSGPAGVKPW